MLHQHIPLVFVITASETLMYICFSLLIHVFFLYIQLMRHRFLVQLKLLFRFAYNLAENSNQFSGVQVVAGAGKPNGSHLLVNDSSKYKSFLVRAYSTVWMIGGFALIVYLGHLYITAMVVIIQIFMARELFNLLRRTHEDKQLPGFRLLNW